MRLRTLPALLCMLCCSLPAAAPAQGGATGMAFLKLGVGGRSVAMGDAGVVSSTGGAASYYNPANILEGGRPSILLMHNQWIQDIATEYLGAAVPLGDWGLAFHVNSTGIDNIEVREVPGEAAGTFNARNLSIGMSAAFRAFDDWSAGVTVKYLYEKIYVDQADGYAFDAGIRYRTPIPGLSAGAAAANLGSMAVLRTEATRLPALFRAGAAYQTPVPAFDGTLLVEADGFTLFKDPAFHLQLGAEADYRGIVFLRAGYQTGYDVRGFSAGLGARIGVLGFDYGFTPFQNDLGSSHTVSLEIRL